MPGVNPPADGGYNYYQKQISELEDEIRKQAKRQEERRDERLEKLEESYRADSAKKEEDMARTIAQVKEKYGEALTSEREKGKADVNDIKAKTYDKWGRYNGQEADVVKAQMKEALQAWDQQHQSDQRALSDQDQATQQKIEEMARENQDKVDQVARTTRDSANATYTATMDSEKEQYNSFKKEAEAQTERLNRERMDEMNFQRRERDKALSDTKFDFDHRTTRNKENEDARFARQQAAYELSNKQHSRSLAESHADEAMKLRDQMRDLAAYSADMNKKATEKLSHDEVELEKEWMTKSRLQDEASRGIIDNLTQKSKEAEANLSRKNNENLRDKEDHFTRVISDQILENRSAQAELIHNFNNAEHQLELRNSRDRQMATDTLSNARREDSENSEKALMGQAKQYQSTLQNMRESDQDKIHQLEKTLSYKSTSDDVSTISPAAEAAVRKSFVKEYEKTLSAERDRSNASIDSVQRSYSTRLQEKVNESVTDRTELQRQGLFERNQEKGELLKQLADTQYAKDATLRNMETDHARETENLNRNFASMLGKQRAEYEEMLQNARFDAAFKLQEARQEAEYNSKMQQRAFSTQQSELIRTYEKKLADLKLESDQSIDQTKSLAERTVRENDKKNRTALEEQGRLYEQRLAQLEQQHKERERFVTQNLNDEIEKARRSNALLIQKKS